MEIYSNTLIPVFLQNLEEKEDLKILEKLKELDVWRRKAAEEDRAIEEVEHEKKMRGGRG